MPQFEVDNLSTPDGRWWTVHRVQATMLFPEDPAEQSKYLAAVAALCLLSPALPSAVGTAELMGRLIAVNHGSAKAIFERHGGAQAAHARGFDFYQDQIRRSHGRWLMAGNLLTTLLRLTRHKKLQRSASINMAAYMLEKEQPFPGVMAANRKDILEAWSRCKPVAHFCGAFSNLYVHALRAGADADERTAFIHDRLFSHTREFLQEAAFYQSFGLSHKLPRTKDQTPLDPNVLYQVPPLGQEEGELAILPLSDRLAEIARRYTAQKRWYG
jgi:hypothetical protein